MLLNRKAQSTLEYAVLIAIIVAAFLTMQIYMKRGVQGKLRSAADQIGDQFDAHKTNSTYTTKRTGTTVEEVTAGVTSSYAGADNKGTAEVTKKTGTETVGAW
jgi:uncharacterized protein (UPF0333 family)